MTLQSKISEAEKLFDETRKKEIINDYFREIISKKDNLYYYLDGDITYQIKFEIQRI